MKESVSYLDWVEETRLSQDFKIKPVKFDKPKYSGV